MPQLRERLRLDLADPLPRDTELPADLFERAWVTVRQSEPELDDLLLPLRERMEDGAELLLQQDERGRVHRNDGVGVLDEVAEVGILFLADRRLQRHGLLGLRLDLADLVRADPHDLADLLGRRL